MPDFLAQIQALDKSTPKPKQPQLSASAIALAQVEDAAITQKLTSAKL